MELVRLALVNKARKIQENILTSQAAKKKNKLTSCIMPFYNHTKALSLLLLALSITLDPLESDLFSSGV